MSVLSSKCSHSAQVDVWGKPASFRNVASIRPGPEMPIHHVVGNSKFYKQYSWAPQNLGTRGQEKHLFKEEKERPP